VILDVMMPGINGFAVCRHIKQNPLTRLVPLVMLTILEAKEHRIERIQSGADDFLTKPVEFEELTARAASLIRLKRFTDDLESAQSVIDSLALTVEARDPYTEGHCQRLAAATESRDQETGMHLERISRMCERMGLAMGMTPTEAETLRNASLLHDVGKIGVPDAILLQPGALSPEDRELMRRHTTVGAELLSGSDSPVMRMAEEIARTHHERWDGKGYPAGLAGEAIPLSGRICAVCDVFDALLSDRPYKEPWPVPEALDQLRSERGKHFDPAVVDTFLAIVDDLDPRLLASSGRPGSAPAGTPGPRAAAPRSG